MGTAYAGSDRELKLVSKAVGKQKTIKHTVYYSQGLIREHDSPFSRVLLDNYSIDQLPRIGLGILS